MRRAVAAAEILHKRLKFNRGFKVILVQRRVKCFLKKYQVKKENNCL